MKALVAIASYGLTNEKYLARLVSEYQSMSLDVDIVVISNLRKPVAPGVEVLVVDLKGKDPWSLPFIHKELFASRIDNYELFIYSEDDTLILERNLRAFLDVSAVLPEDEIPGFLRFEEAPDGKLNYPEMHGHFHWDPGSVRVRGDHTLAFFTNEHSACYVLTREQLRRAIVSGGFLVPAHSGKYDLLCTAATDPYTQCGFRKLICISHLADFLIHHLPNKYVGTSFGVDDAELRRQVQVLLQLGKKKYLRTSLFDTETKLPDWRHSKSYYEEIQTAVIDAIPAGVRTVLSIGCGWGATEARLALRGLRVTAVPIDAVIAGGAQAEGVEVVTGDFATIRTKLSGRKFDCLLLSNTLHLISDPSGVLASFGSLLAPGGVSIAMVPHISHLGLIWKALRRDRRIKILASHGETGVHLVSHRVVKKWVRNAGMRVEGISNILGSRAEGIRRFTPDIVSPWLADSFIAVAKRTSDAHLD